MVVAKAKVKLRNVLTPRALGCYVTLAKPRAVEVGKEPEYSLTLVWDPKRSDLSDLRKAIAEAAIVGFGPNGPVMIGGKLRNPLRDGNTKTDDEGNIDPHFKGKVFLNARSKQRVQVVDADQKPIDPNEAYSGCFFHAQLRFFPYDQKGNKGVGVGLQNIMLVGHGPRIDGRESPEQAFKNFEPETGDVGTSDLDALMGGMGTLGGASDPDNIPF